MGLVVCLSFCGVFFVGGRHCFLFKEGGGEEKEDKTYMVSDILRKL